MSDLIGECEHTLLPRDACSHCRGLDVPDDEPARAVRLPMDAVYAGTCHHCGQHFEPGTSIVLAQVDIGDQGWVLTSHSDRRRT